MKYLYKNTGVIVESGRKLDSAVFTPYEECNTENPVNDTEKAETESKQPKRKPAAKK